MARSILLRCWHSGSSRAMLLGGEARGRVPMKTRKPDLSDHGVSSGRTAMAVPVLLAPAGSPEAVLAALDAGADAVYVGLAGWSRGGARGELGWDELVAAQREVASAGRKLQVALNTIPKPQERAQLFERVSDLLDLGIQEV